MTLATDARTLSEWLPYWRNELGARNVRPATVTNQTKVLTKLARFTGKLEPEHTTTGDLSAWRDHMRGTEGLKASSVNRYLLTAGTFYNWLVSEGVIANSPMRDVRLLRDRNTESPAVLDTEALRRIAKGAGVVKPGRSKFEALRDQAILSLLQDTGIRASECSGLMLNNVNLAARQTLVHADAAKGGYERTVTFGFQTARLLNRYMRARKAHSYSFLPELFVGRRGALTYHGIWELVRKAAQREGVIGARPHLYRHTWAHDLKAEGVDTEVLMSLGGWRTLTMPLRYGRAERDARAAETYRRIGSPVDRATVARRAGQD